MKSKLWPQKLVENTHAHNLAALCLLSVSKSTELCRYQIGGQWLKNKEGKKKRKQSRRTIDRNGMASEKDYSRVINS